MRTRGEFARQMARKYLRQHRVMSPPVPVEYMLVAEGFAVELADYEDATAGEAWWEEGVGHVAVNRQLRPGRLRFTLAHEFGHLALRHHERRFGDLARNLPRFRDPDDLAWEPPDLVEVEANQFAAELLMPAAMFRRDWERNPSPGRLAARYEVSIEAVRWRIVAVCSG